MELAAYPDTQGVVYRQSETQVIQARQNQWAQRLSPQLTQRITNDCDISNLATGLRL
ncbi:putative lipoprotein [Vibrio cholerae CT 5369-93]|nr:putative lipoprotein [Vibrio cholerae CT 5369-93]